MPEINTVACLVQVSFLFIPFQFHMSTKRWYLDTEAIICGCSMELFGGQDRIDITVSEVGNELEMPGFL